MREAVDVLEQYKNDRVKLVVINRRHRNKEGLAT